MILHFLHMTVCISWYVRVFDMFSVTRVNSYAPGLILFLPLASTFNNKWEFYTVSVNELVFTTISGIVVVCSVGFFLIHHWSAVFFLLPMLCMVYVDLLGTLEVSASVLEDKHMYFDTFLIV